MDPKSICMVELSEYPGSITVSVHKMNVHNVLNRMIEFFCFKIVSQIC